MMSTFITICGWLFIVGVAACIITFLYNGLGETIDRRKRKRDRKAFSQFGAEIQSQLYWLGADKYKPFKLLLDHIVWCAKDNGGFVRGSTMRETIDNIIENQNKEQ